MSRGSLFKLRPPADCPQKYAMRMDEVSCRTVRMYEWVYESVSVCVCAVVSITVLVELRFLLLILHFLSAPPLPVCCCCSFLPSNLVGLAIRRLEFLNLVVFATKETTFDWKTSDFMFLNLRVKPHIYIKYVLSYFWVN